MPILNVEIVMPGNTMAPPDLSRSLAEAAGRVFGTPAGRTWVVLHEVRRHCYAENGSRADGEALPVFVRVLKAAAPAGSDLEKEVMALSRAVARTCDRPVDSVHILYEPPAAGRIAFGGELMKG